MYDFSMMPKGLPSVRNGMVLNTLFQNALAVTSSGPPVIMAREFSRATAIECSIGFSRIAALSRVISGSIATALALNAKYSSVRSAKCSLILIAKSEHYILSIILDGLSNFCQLIIFYINKIFVKLS